MSSSVGESASPRSFARRRPHVAFVLLTLAVGLAVARLLLNVEPGLNVEYFEGGQTAPSIRAIDAQPSTGSIERRWPPIAPGTFRVRWYGFLGITEPGSYTFTVTADDGARLVVDGSPLIDTGDSRGTFTQSATANLTAGLHAVVIDYRQAGGDYAFDWRWSTGGGGLEAVPSWRLVPRRGAWAAQRAARWIDAALIVASMLLAGWIAFRNKSAVYGGARRHPMAAVFLLFLAMTVVQTWPLASDPAHLSRNDNADTVLNEWALSWVAHQAVRDPLHLFDANIFYPERYTLAYSESMIVQAAMAAPLLWSGLSPVLVYNLLVIAGFALNGFVMTWVMRRWTGDMPASIAAGILFAFNSNILTRLPHMQALHVEFLPVALLAWDLLLREERVKHALLFGAAVALQSLTSVYLLVFTFSAVSAAVIARASEWAGSRFRRVVPLVLLAAVVAAAMTVPFLLPYLWTHEQQGFERSLDDARNLAATLGSYLASPSQLHYGLWSHRWFDSPSALFPGVTAVLLALVAIVRGVAFRDRRARLGLALLVCGLLLSFGPKVPGYSVLFTYVPLFRVVRVVSSFGYIALVGLAIVAGYGMMELRAIAGMRAWRPVAAAVFCALFVEPLSAPLELVRFTGIPHIYDLLKDDHDAVVVEVPFYTASAGFQQAGYMLSSTRHWRPMLNGYSGYRPASYYETADALAGFPSAASLAWLRQRGVTHLFVQLGAYGDDVPSRLAEMPGVFQVASDRGIALYRISAPASASSSASRSADR